ncbi:uncharacterized protein LOC122265184 [Penaeus japonicus]|uniref:uncharacterized protein LOC122265184 n=1 Tax=Penaeus japonicus TaxID=27405 RepID=UPI001C70EE40|nr:uncharacterized protein LOC122265184 [Penaeus japonicus]
METKAKWLWKKTLTENFFETFAISYQLSIVTREPLLEEQLIRALTICQRKVLPLRTCYGERDGETWLREMTQEIVDFELLSDDEKNEDLHRRLHGYNFNTQTGPLWCVKLRRDSHSSPECVFSEEVPGFPHKYSLFLGINHAITDGTSNVIICGFLIQILEDVLFGKEINDKEQLGVFISDEKTNKVKQEQVAVVKGNPELQRTLIKDWQVLQERRSIHKAIFKGVGEKKARTAFLTQSLDAETTAAFIKRCRVEGVTVNSAFTAVCNFAMVDLLVSGGLEQDSYSIQSTHVLNTRRYWEDGTSQYLGCHISLLSGILETPRNFGENFWKHVKPINEEFQMKFKSAYSLQLEGVKELVSETPDFDPTYEFEFCLTNMGLLSKSMTEGGDHVRAVHLLRTVDLNDVSCIYNNFLHTLNRRLTHTLVYNTSLATSHMAKLFCERAFHYLQASLKI